MIKPLITLGRLKEVISYNPKTGVLCWKIDRTAGIPAGTIAGSIMKGRGHRVIRIDWKIYLAHRLAWFYVHGAWPKDQIDHINCDPDDNRLVNLRESSQAENTRNQRKSKRNTSGFKGVTLHKPTGKWMAQIVAHGKHYYLGLFDTPEEAHAVYCEAAIRLHGAFARFE